MNSNFKNSNRYLGEIDTDLENSGPDGLKP